MTGDNSRQKLFVEYILDGFNPLRAATFAGYTNPENYAYVLIKDPKIIKAISDSTKTWLYTDALPKARKKIVELIEDPQTPKNVQFQASKYVLDSVREQEQSDGIDRLLDKKIDDMTPDELDIVIEEGRRLIRISARKTTGKQEAIDMGIIEAEEVS